MIFLQMSVAVVIVQFVFKVTGYRMVDKLA
jgi:hypothetical protein